MMLRKNLYWLLMGLVVISCGTNIKSTPPYKIELHKTLYGHSEWVRAVGFNPKKRAFDGIDLITVGDDGRINLWDSEDHNLIYTITANEGGHSRPILAASFSENGRYFVTAATDYQIKLWDTSNGKLNFAFVQKPHTDKINSLSFNSNNKYIASASSDHSVKIWNISTGYLEHNLGSKDDRHTDVILAVDYNHVSYKSAKNNILASASADKKIKIWNTKSGKLMKELGENKTAHVGAVNTVKFSPNGAYLASGSSDKTIKIWDFVENKLLKKLEIKNGLVNSIDFSPDNNLLVSGSSDGIIRIWHVKTGSLIKKIGSNGHLGSINSVRFSPKTDHYPNNYFTFATGSDDRTVKIWRIWY